MPKPKNQTKLCFQSFGSSLESHPMWVTKVNLYIFIFAGTSDGSNSSPNRDPVRHLSELQDHP